jgi:hypothetical protein
MKIAVVTASIGTNELIVPPHKFDNVDYHAFIDNDNEVNGWNVHKYVDFSCDPKYKNRRNAKIYKIIPHLFVPGYDYYFWIDSTHVLDSNPLDVIDTYLKNSDVAVFKHPERNCIYEEGEVVKNIKFDYPNLIDDQLAFYRDMCYPEGNGLYELPVRVQKNTELTQRMGLMWWEQICMFSSRDQISFPFVCYQLGIIPSIMPGRANTIRGNSIMPQITTSHHNRRF